MAIHTNASILALATMMALAPGAAAAQTAAPAPVAATPADPSTSDTSDIVVTAQRRSENLQTVPVAITVVGGAALRSANINSTETLDRVVPSLTFKRGTANVNSTIAIRGLGTQSFASGAEPSVSTIIDGVVYGRSGMATQEFADIDRIEVLRGPQGTLFGKNASAGALNIVSRAPTKVFAAEASAAYYDRQEYRASATVSGPVTPDVGALLSGYYGYYDGNAVNVANGTYVNGYKRYGVKGKLKGEFGDLDVLIAADYSHENDDCCGDILGTVIPMDSSPTSSCRSSVRWCRRTATATSTTISRPARSIPMPAYRRRSTSSWAITPSRRSALIATGRTASCATAISARSRANMSR